MFEALITFLSTAKISDYINVFVPITLMALTFAISHYRDRRKYRLSLHTKYKFFLSIVEKYISHLSTEIKLLSDVVADMKSFKINFLHTSIPSFIIQELSKIDKNSIYSYLDLICRKEDFVNDFVRFLSLIDNTIIVRLRANDCINLMQSRISSDIDLLDNLADQFQSVWLRINDFQPEFPMDINFISNIRDIILDLPFRRAENRFIRDKLYIYEPFVNVCSHPEDLSPALAKIRVELHLLSENALHIIAIHEDFMVVVQSELHRCIHDLSSASAFIASDLPAFQKYLSRQYYP